MNFSYLCHFLIPLILSISLQLASRVYATQDFHVQCRCFPGDTCWPTEQDWNAFNQSVQGRLIRTVPIGSVCHGETFNADQCGQLQAAWDYPQTHYQSSSSIMAPYFANDSCNPFLLKDSQCVIGTYVQYAVNVSDVLHIQSALKFTKERNLRFLVRNTGHDYYGKSTGAGALAVWTHFLKDFKVLDYKSGYYTGKAVKLGAGIQSEEATAMAFKEGLTIVGGECPTVGLAGGYTQGGGYGPLTSRYGFAADQVLEWEVLTAEGSILIASPVENHDLYWALSGGGGGVFGVVLSMTVRAYANEPTAAANLSFAANGTDYDDFYEAIEAFLSCLPALADAGGTAVWYVEGTGFSLVPATGPGMTKDHLDQIFEPALQKLDDLRISYEYLSANFSSYYESYIAYDPPSLTSYAQIGGRLIPPSVVTDNSSELVQTIRKIVNYGAGVSGTSFKAPQNIGISNSVNPEFRKALINLTIGTIWNNTNWSQDLQDQNLMTDTLIPALAELLPGGGSTYLNEGNFLEPKWQQVFYGANYGNLLNVKYRYDPNSIFWGRTAVGSEAWSETHDKRLCRVVYKIMSAGDF